MARRWADARTPEWVETILQERDIWVFESDGVLVGWISVSADTIDGLYTLPLYEQRGVGSSLLAFAEAEMRRRGLQNVQLEASWNTEDYYRRRGYEPVGPRPPDGAKALFR